MGRYKWQGEPCAYEFGYVAVTYNEEKPLYWYNYEVYLGKGRAIIPAIRVTYGEEVFVISNHHGIGAHKLRNGGWPNYRHFSLPGDTFKASASIVEIHDKKLQLEDFEAQEANRRAWQKKEYPVEFERLEKLRLSIAKKR